MFAESAGGGRPKMKVTLHEVAARADVSIATVSRALNGLPVSEKNLARVREAVAELGYVANEAARALRSDRSMTMGIIFSDLRNNLGIDLLDALSDTLEEAGYSLLIATAKGEARRFDTLHGQALQGRGAQAGVRGRRRRHDEARRSGSREEEVGPSTQHERRPGPRGAGRRVFRNAARACGTPPRRTRSGYGSGSQAAGRWGWADRR